MARQAGMRLEKGEKYVAPLYNALISRGLPVHVLSMPLSQVAFLGTPDEVEGYTRGLDGKRATFS
jgi:hypothetical protein